MELKRRNEGRSKAGGKGRRSSSQQRSSATGSVLEGLEAEQAQPNVRHEGQASRLPRLLQKVDELMGREAAAVNGVEERAVDVNARRHQAQAREERKVVVADEGVHEVLPFILGQCQRTWEGEGEDGLGGRRPSCEGATRSPAGGVEE